MVISSGRNDQPGAKVPMRFGWRPVRKLARAVTLKEVKADPALADMDLLTKFRLSVSSVKPAEWEHILKLSES